MCAMADDNDAAYSNSAGFAFQTGSGGVLTKSVVSPWPWRWHGTNGWLPRLYPGMMLVCASGGTDRLLPSVAGRPVNVGADLLYLSTGETDVINERNEFLGRYTTWDGAFGVHAAMKFSKQLGIGASLKLIYSYLVFDWVWTEMPELGHLVGRHWGDRRSRSRRDVSAH